MATLFRTDGWVKSAIGPAVPGAQVYICAPQPANVSAVPPSPLADIFSDSFGLVPIVQPIITDGFGHYDFYSASKLVTLVVALGGVIQQVYIDQTIGGFGTSNPPGNDTGLIAGTNITIVGSTINATAGGADIEVNDVPVADQSLMNFSDSPTVAWASDGSGKLFATVASVPAAQAINNVRIWKAIPNSASVGDTIGFLANISAASTGLITPTATDTNYATILTSAVGGNQATVCFTSLNGFGINPNVGQLFTTQTLLAVKWHILLPDTADVRIWMGMMDAYISNIPNLKSDTPSTMNIMAFRYSTAAGDTTWQAVCSDTIGQTTVDTLVPVDTFGHTFTITPTPTGIEFQIDNTVVAHITTHVPANTVRVGDILSVDNVGLTNIKSVGFNLVATLEP